MFKRLESISTRHSQVSRLNEAKSDQRQRFISGLRAKQIIEKHNFENTKINNSSFINAQASTQEGTTEHEGTSTDPNTYPISPDVKTEAEAEGDEICPIQTSDNGTDEAKSMVTLDLKKLPEIDYIKIIEANQNKEQPPKIFIEQKNNLPTINLKKRIDKAHTLY